MLDLPLLVIFALSAVMMLLLVVWGLIRNPRQIQFYDEGMLVRWLSGQTWYDWGSVTLTDSHSVYNYGVTTLTVFIHIGDGRKLIFADVVGKTAAGDGPQPYLPIEQVAELVTAQSRDGRRQAALARYDRGDPVDFKRLKLSRAGVTAGWKTLPWPEVARIDVERVYVAIYAVDSGQPWRTFKREALPNADILADVAAYAERVR